MKIIKKYTAIQIDSNTVNNCKEASFNFGEITGPYWNQQYPEIEHDSEQEAIEYAYKMNIYATWLIVPVIKFESNIK